MAKKKYTSETESGALTPDLRQAVADIKTAIFKTSYLGQLMGHLTTPILFCQLFLRKNVLDTIALHLK